MSEVAHATRWRDTRAAAGAPPSALLSASAIGCGLFLLVDAIVVANAARVVYAGAAAIAYPFELDFGEGLVLAATRALATGRPVYQAAEQLPATISNYPPVYYAAVAAAGAAFSDHVAVGRALSLLSAILIAVALGVLAWRALDPTSGSLRRTVTAVCAGAMFLQISYTATWAALMRVDLLAILLAVAGVIAFGATAGRGRHVYWCLVPFLLAAYTKQTTVAAAAACMLTLARSNVRRGALLAGAFAAATLLIGAAMQIATHGGFAFNVITANMNPYSWDQTASYLQDIAIRYPVLIALATVIAPRLIRSPDWTRAALGAYLPIAALTSLTVGKLGAEVNYLIELMAVVAICAAVAVGEALASSERAAASYRGSRALAVALPVLLLWQVAWLASPRTVETIETPAPSEQAQLGSMVEMVRSVNGPVLSEDLVLLERADKPIPFQPSDITQLIYRGARDEAPLIETLARGGFTLVVLRFDVLHPPPMAFYRFPPAALATIRDRYRPLSRFPGYWLYAPR